MAHCVNRSHPDFLKLADITNINPIILAAKISLWQEENGLDKFPTVQELSISKDEMVKLSNFTIQNNGTFLNLSEEKKKEIFENYVNLMDRKREGKSIDFDKFNQMFENLQVFSYKDTYIFGEWDGKNNVFKGRLMSSPGIKELYGALDVLFKNVNFVASVPSDIGAMLEKKGLYKLNVGKEYNFRGEEMIKNLYFSNKDLVEKIFKTSPENVTAEQIKKYDTFFNYWSLIFNLKKEYENKNFNNILPLLKELGIYDFNAYKLVKKIKLGKITNDDAESIVKEIIKNSSNNKVNIDKTDLINNPKIYNELNNDLNKTLATYLSKFGIKTETLEDMQNELGIDSFAHVDILNKIIYVDKNNQQNYPQQTGKLIAFMMQHNPLMQEVTSKMKKLSIFNKLSNEELFEAVGDLISEQLYKKTNTELPKDLLESIKNLIRQFFNYLNNIQIARINKNIGFIADNILIQNQSLITQSVYKPGSPGKEVSKISLEEALKSDEFGNRIVEDMAKYFILTGSITLSEQGTVYRPNENQIHDLDWVSSLPRDKSIKIFNKLYPNNKFIRNIFNKDYQTDTWLIAPEGYDIKNLKIDNSKGTNKIIGYDIVDLNNDIVSSYIPLTDSHTGKIEAKLIDIFTYDNVTEERTANKEITLESGTKLKIADWRNTFSAKLEFGRLKDIWDYNRFIPNDNIFKEEINENIPVKPGVEELFDSNPELANKVYEALGIEINNFKLKINEKAFGKPHLEGANSYDIFYKNKKIGKIALFDGKNPMIKGIELNESERNKGIGKALYKWLNYKANLNGGTLYGDQEFISLSAQKVWESLNKEGLIDLTGNAPKFNNQQKQQALQLYSQYIDTGKQDIEGFKEFVSGKQQKNKEEIYLQKEAKSKEKADKELNNLILNFLEKLGISVNSVNDIRDANGNVIDAVAKADMLNKIIDIVEGKADITTLPEEAAHFFVEMLGENNELLKQMMSKITSYKIYQETVEQYRNNAQYRNKDGSLNINKLKKEAIGKLISQHIVKNASNETNANLKTFDSWWSKLWNLIKNIFNKSQTDPFKTAAEKILKADVSELSETNINKQVSIINYLV